MASPYLACTPLGGALRKRAVIQIHMSNSPRHSRRHSRSKNGVASLAYVARHVGTHAGVFHRPVVSLALGLRLLFLSPSK
jgi:hypothetical protein